MNYPLVSSWCSKTIEDEILLQAKSKDEQQKAIVWKDNLIKSQEMDPERKLKKAKAWVKTRTHQSINEFQCQKFHQILENQVGNEENQPY